MNQKEMISKAGSSVKALLRSSAILMQVAYDMHFEKDVADVANNICVNIQQLTDKLHDLKLAYSQKLTPKE